LARLVTQAVSFDIQVRSFRVKRTFLKIPNEQ
jgi:hypothetical protein